MFSNTKSPQNIFFYFLFSDVIYKSYTNPTDIHVDTIFRIVRRQIVPEMAETRVFLHISSDVSLLAACPVCTAAVDSHWIVWACSKPHPLPRRCFPIISLTRCKKTLIPFERTSFVIHIRVHVKYGLSISYGSKFIEKLRVDNRYINR